MTHQPGSQKVIGSLPEEVEVGELGVQGQPWLHSKLEANLDYGDTVFKQQ